MARFLAVVVVGFALVGGACGEGVRVPEEALADLPLLPAAATTTAAAGTAEASSTDAAAGTAETSSTDRAVAATEYRLADDLDPMGGAAPAYRVDASTGEHTVGALANALGVDGELREEAASWSLTGDAGAIHVGVAGQWLFAALLPEPQADAAASAPPAPAEAERLARDLAARTGSAAEGAATVDATPYATSVRIAYEVGDVEVEGLDFVVGFGPGGRLVDASGWFVRPSRIGDYPLVSSQQAWEAMGSGAAVTAVVEPAIASDLPAGDEPVAQEPPAPAAEPELRIVDRVERLLTVAHPVCEGDAMYLVPAYRFHVGDEVVGTVAAVTAEHVRQSGGSEDPDAPVSSTDAHPVEQERCPGVETVPGREPTSPPVTG